MKAIFIILLVVLASCLNDVKAATCADGNPCNNGATCLDLGANTQMCLCTRGWAGDFCDYPDSIQVCPSNPCHYGATCSVISGVGFKCTCPPHFTGILCDIADNSTYTCQNKNPCFNGATCLDIAPYTFRCVCASEYTGYLCASQMEED